MNITNDGEHLSIIAKKKGLKALLELKNRLDELYGTDVNFIVAEATCYIYNNNVLEEEEFIKLKKEFQFNIAPNIFNK